jgi:hypothetical protein
MHRQIIDMIALHTRQMTAQRLAYPAAAPEGSAELSTIRGDFAADSLQVQQTVIAGSIDG